MTVGVDRDGAGLDQLRADVLGDGGEVLPAVGRRVGPSDRQSGQIRLRFRRHDRDPHRRPVLAEDQDDLGRRGATTNNYNML